MENQIIPNNKLNDILALDEQMCKKYVIFPEIRLKKEFSKYGVFESVSKK